MTGGKTGKTDLTKNAVGKCTRYMNRKNKLHKKNMKKELEKYPVYLLSTSGELIKIFLNNLDNYDHSRYELHHFIQYQAYRQNPEWYMERGIEQKLILVNKICHEHIENRGIKVLTDEEFEQKYKISRWKLIFNRKHSSY